MSRKFLNPKELAEKFKEMIPKNLVKEYTKFEKIDSCRVKCSKCIFKVKFDSGCNKFFNMDEGCDFILFFNDKIYLCEVKKGKFGRNDARKAVKQLKICYDTIKKLRYEGYMGFIVLYNSTDSIAVKWFKDKIKKGFGRLPKFYKCGSNIQ